MYVVLGLGITNYPIVYNCKVIKDKGEALDLAVELCLEQGASETAKEIRAELEEEGFYIPTKHAEWSVYVYEV
jgi:hypothetical protein